MDNIPDLRPLKISYFYLSSWKHLKGLHFPRMTDSRISLLIGANIPKAHCVLNQRRAGSNEPYAIKSPLGWVIRGPMGSTTKITEESKDTLSNNITVASAADAGAPNCFASPNFFETNLPSIEPFVSAETTDTKVEATSFGTCILPQKTFLQESTGKADQRDT